MTTDRDEDLQRGAELLGQLPEITSDSAEQSVRGLFLDAEQTLRVPVVNQLFRVLVHFPFFPKAWFQLKPWLRTNRFEELAAELRDHARLEARPSVAPQNWAALGDLPTITTYTATMHYVLPKLLLVATALDECLCAATDRDTTARRHMTHSTCEERLPLGTIQGARNVEMIDPNKTEGRLRAVFDDIKNHHGHPGVGGYFRALGNWPDFLTASWEYLRPLIGTDTYRSQRETLIKEAERMVQHSPAAGIRLELDTFPEERRQLHDACDVVRLFRLQLIPDLLLDVSCIESLLSSSHGAAEKGV